MELSKLKMPTISNNFIVWAIIIFILLAFSNASSTLGINIFAPPPDKHNSSHKHYDGKYPPPKGGTIGPIKNPIIPIPAAGGLNGILGGNGLFLIAVIALIFLCKEKEEEKENECCNDQYTDNLVSIDEMVNENVDENLDENADENVDG